MVLINTKGDNCDRIKHTYVTVYNLIKCAPFRFENTCKEKILVSYMYICSAKVPLKRNMKKKIH